MDAREYKMMSMEEFKENWPTPAESRTKMGSNTVPNAHMEYSNTGQLQTQDELQTDISFLQPSVVYPSPQPDKYRETYDSMFDTCEDKDISAPNPNIHIWSQTLEEDINVGKEIHPAILSQLKPCRTKDDHNCLYNAICLCLGIPESQQSVLRELTVTVREIGAKYAQIWTWMESHVL